MEFYTYLWLREDGTPYYVGKGKGRRAFTSRGHSVVCPKDESYIILQKHESEADAFAAERFLIEYWGRINLDSGCLRNLTDGGEGIINISPEARLRQLVGLARSRTPEHQRKAGIQGGLHAVKTGQVQALGKRIGAYATTFCTPEMRRAAGHKSGKLASERGQIQALARENHKKPSFIAATRLNVQKQSDRKIGIFAPGWGKYVMHLRWHVRRAQSNPQCLHCKGINNVNNSNSAVE
jgi:hypothetical protein